MVRFIPHEDDKVLIEVCVRDKSFTCGILYEDGGVRFFKRYFLEHENSKLFPSELLQIAEKGEEMARAYRDRPPDYSGEDIPWEELFG